MADIIQIRRDSAANWSSANPVLANGEIGLEMDTKKLKVGDGVTAWNTLDYWLTGAAGAIWGAITGTLSDQTDLQTALDGKVAKAGDVMTGSLVIDTLVTIAHPTNSDLNILIDPASGRMGALGASISKPGASGFLHLMPNAEVIQWILGNPAAANGVNAFYWDCDNEGIMYLNTLPGGGRNADVVITYNAALRPGQDATSNLGSASFRWNEVRAVTLFGDGANITGIDKYTQSEVDGLLLLKEDAFTKNTAFNKDFGTAAGTVCEGNDARLSDARTPLAHNTSHQSGGGDAIKLDDLAAPDDNTDLDASAAAHGLLPKLSNVATEFLDGQGNWSTPVGGPLVKMFQGIDTSGGMAVTNVAQTVQMDYESIKDSYYSHSTTVNPGEVTILNAGWYKISAMVTIQVTDALAGVRGAPTLGIEIDTGSGFVLQPDKMSSYTRENAAGLLSAAITGIGFFQFNANDKLRLVVYDQVPSEPNEETVAYSSRILLEYIDRTGAASGSVDNLKDIGDVDALAPSDGDILIFNGTTSEWESGPNPGGGSSVFGSEWDSAESIGDSVTTSTTFQQKLRLSVNVPAGNYLVAWTCEAFPKYMGDGIKLQFEQDDTTLLGEGTIWCGDTGYANWFDNYDRWTGFRVLALNGLHTFDIDYRSQRGVDVHIRRATITIWRVS